MTKAFAVINGATGGMGSAIADQLAENYNLILLGRDERALQQLSRNIKNKYSETITKYFLVDMLNSSSLVKTANLLQQENCPIQVLIHSIGIVPVGGILEVSEADWQQTFQISFMSAVTLIRTFAPLMKQSGGSIVIINGVLAIQPDPQFIVSSAVTGALRNFTKAISKDLINYGIRVNGILPGATKTALWDKIATQLSAKLSISVADISNNVETSNPSKRLANPQDIANTVSFLCSEQASYINGSFITVDGGASLAI